MGREVIILLQKKLIVIIVSLIVVLLISGAGIGWLGSLDLLPELDSDKDIQSPIESSQPFTLSNAFSNTAATEPLPEPSNTLTTTNNNISFQPLLTNILSSNSGPSPEYLQSLLHVNEVLLAQSLANTGDDSTINKTQLNEDMIDPSTITPFLTPAIMDSTNINDISCDQYTNTPTSPLITPTFTNNDDTLPSSYIGNTNPDSEKILSPLVTTNIKPFIHTITTATTATPSENNNNVQF